MRSEQREINRLVRERVQLILDHGIPMEALREYLVLQHPSELFAELRLIRQELHELRSNKGFCALAEGSGERSNVMQLLTGISGNLAPERKHVGRRTKNSSSLIICDPYFFSWSGPNKGFSREREYTNYIIGLIPREVRRLEVYHLPGPNSRIFGRFKKEIGSRNIQVSYYQTTEIHDRVIIDANDNGTLLGTSFGGLGNKLAFVLDIPIEDVKAFKIELARIKNT